MLHEDRLSPFTLFVLLIASFGGILFGYHTAVISGVLTSVATTFKLSVLQQGFVVSTVLLGGLAGSIFAGQLADRLGRKMLMLITAIIFCISSLWLTFADSYTIFLTGRFISGVAIGFSAIVSPIYLGEIAPPRFRGRFVSLFQLMLGVGILLAYTINLLFALKYGWRLAFFISLIPAAIQLIGLFFLPETPAWLFSHHNKKKAAKTLKHLRENSEWKESLHEMKTNEELETGIKESIWNPRFRLVIFIGLLLSIFQQITGINAVIYYAPKLFNSSQATSTHQALLATLAVGIVNVVATIIALSFLDRLGRRLFLLIGVAGMLICQLLLSSAYAQQPVMEGLALAGAMGFVAFFAIGLGPITWVILSEIFPLKIRGKAIGIALFANWLFNYIIAFTFLILIQKLGISGTFLLYGIITLAALFFIYFFIPETKGKSLEEIEAIVVKGKLDNFIK